MLDGLGVTYFLGGSVASSVHGVPRASIDADVIADLGVVHVAPFVSRLSSEFYLDEARVRSAVNLRRSFNVIHLDTMFKVDVFVNKGRPYDKEALRRAQATPLEDSPGAPAFRVATPEDTVLAKLEWFRAGGETSQRQWTDILGVLRSAAAGLDEKYLGTWAAALGVADLLRRAREDALDRG